MFVDCSLIKGSRALLTGMMIWVLMATSSCGTGYDDPEDSDPNNQANVEILNNLGFSTNQNEPVPDRNPLGGTQKTLLPVYEVFHVGAKIGGSMLQLKENPNSSWNSLYSQTWDAANGSMAWMTLPKKTVSGDTNGDGYDELVSAVFITATNEIQFHITDRKNDQNTVVNVQEDMVSALSDTALWAFRYYFMRDFCSGDFNGDGFDEFVLSIDNKILLFSSNLSTVVWSCEYSDKGSNFVRVEAGDLNDDGFDDLAVTHGTAIRSLGQLYLHAGSQAGLGESPVYSGPLAGKSITYSCAEVVIGDVDGNGLNDLVLSGARNRTDWTTSISISLLDPWNETNASFQAVAMVEDKEIIADGWWEGKVHHQDNLWIPMTATGDFDGNGVDEFLAVDKIYTLNTEDQEIKDFAFQPLPARNNRFHDMFFDLAVSGDMTGDGKDELAIIRVIDLPWGGATETINFRDFRIWGKTDSGGYDWMQAQATETGRTFATLSMANVDDDSLVVKFIRSELSYSDPVILAVLASAPYNDAIDASECNTSFSVSSGTGDSWEFSNGFNVGATIGLSTEIALPVCDVLSIGGGRSASIEHEFLWGYGESTSSSLSYGHDTNAGEDMVIVTVVLTDVYIYEILSSPNPDHIGDFFTISLPRENDDETQLFLTVDFYNSLVKEKDRIPSSMLKHTPGNTDSYYTRDEMEEFAKAGKGIFYTASAVVPQGSAGSTLSFSEDWEGFDTYEYSLTATATLSWRVLLLDVDASAGFSHGYSVQHSIGNGVSIEGRVGSIQDTELWTQNRFKWGMMVIPQSFNDQSYSLVTYWVDPMD